MDATLIQVEVERLRVTVAECEGGFGFGRVGEAVQLGQLHSTVLRLMSRRIPPAPIAASC